jgi:hypothetical protein
VRIREFSEKYRTRANDRRHEEKFGLETSEDTIHGRYGEVVEDPSFRSVLAVKFLAVPRTAVKTGALRSRYRQALTGGLTLKRKHGDAESTFHFDPTDAQQSRLALKLVGAKTRRTVNLTEEQKAALRNRLAAARARKPELVSA